MPARKIAFIYARTDSSRLPGKALINIGGQPLIDIVIARAHKVDVDKVALLTTDRGVDDELANHAEQIGVRVFRGNPFDLVQRTCDAIEHFDADWCIRINGDCPFFEPWLANLAQDHISPSVDFISNLFNRRYPYGVAAEWFNASSYLKWATKANLDELEHVTKHLYRLKAQLSALSIVNPRDDSFYHLTIDNIEDLSRIQSYNNKKNIANIKYWNFLEIKKPDIPYFNAL